MNAHATRVQALRQKRLTARRWYLLAARLLVVAVVVAVVVRYAWVSDDALITLRTSLNTVHGAGPVFNLDERVQAYTHPLWFLLVTLVGGATGQWMLAPMLVGVVLTGAAVALAAWQVRTGARVLLLGLALALSNAFIEYATSGLENSLAYLGVVALWVVLLRPWGRWSGVVIGLLVAAVLLTRLDLLLLLAPAVGWVAWSRRDDRRALREMAGAAIGPLAAWTLFTWVYYGSLMPNTVAAKLNVEIPRGELVVAGLRYLWVSVRHDPVTGLVLVAAALVAVLAGTALARAWMAGVAAYLAYVVVIGGDFMAGRFLAVPVLIGALVLATTPLGLRRRLRSRGASPGRAQALVAGSAAAAAILLLLAGIGRSDALLLSRPDWPRWDFLETGGVADEWGIYAAQGRTLDRLAGPVEWNPGDEGIPDLADLEVLADAWPGPAREIPRPVGVLCGGLGTFGVVSGPRTHWIDTCGLADAFIASIPYRSSDFRWRPGHLDRPVPEGYIDAVRESNADLVTDPVLRAQLRELWARIRG